jgi:hypothetical protein
MTWCKFFGIALVLLNLKTAYSGNDQSKQVPACTGINSKIDGHKDYLALDYFGKETLIEAFSEIVKLDIKESEKINLMTTVYDKAKHLVEKADDYILLIQSTIHKASDSDAKIALTRFIREHMNSFKALKPSIEEVMTLHAYIISIQVYPEQTVATLIKLKEAFIKGFDGCDLIRLLGYGCNNPCREYENQLESLKKIHEIRF